ncbi:MAG: polysaccharide biosynthesis protein [Halobacteriovoraceae bacterium]|nr:polysaccharide biosynthesis protein [Halobacteriovoraceae bacterium]
MTQIFRISKKYIAIFHDLLMIIISFYLACFLRFEFSNPVKEIMHFYPTLLLIFTVKAISFQLFGFYRGIWRYSSIPDLVKIIQSISFGSTLSAGILFLFTRLEGFPRSVFLMDWFILIILVGGSRLLYRFGFDYFETINISKEKKQENIIVIGAGKAGEQITREIKRSRFGYNVVAILDDSTNRQRRTIQGVKIKGGIDELPTIAKKYDVKLVFIAIPSAESDQIRRIVNKCLEAKVRFKTLPSINSIMTEKVALSQLRSVKPEDLLRRSTVNLDTEQLGTMIQGNIILVTGAGGSIGSELCRQLIKFSPRKLVLYEMCELFLFDLENELKNIFPNTEIIPAIGDVRDQIRLKEIFQEHQPHLVFHAAAYKHVPMMEHNPHEAIKTNVIGTYNVAQLAGEFGCKKFTLISTDKAVNPTNIMGTTKRCAEMVNIYMQEKFPQTSYVTVRFGNVLGSNGSVIPTFKRQIQQGGPITVTHPDITRYFMSIPEASQLVLQSTSFGEKGKIFVLDMGSPIKIIDLAKDMIYLAGLKPNIDIEIKITGLRPGEKLYEELFSTQEELTQTSHAKIKVAKARPLKADFQKFINDILKNKEMNKDEVIAHLRQVVPEFSPGHL